MSAQTLAFFSDPHSLLGDAPRRPRSLMSQAALELLGMTVHQPDHQLTLEQEAREIALYDFLHAAPIKDVKLLVTRLDSRAFATGSPVSDETIALFRSVRDEYHALIAASDYRIRLRDEEKQALEKQPADIAYPALMAIRLRRIAEETGWPRDYILWHLPLPEALQLLHASQLAAGRWTIAPSGPEQATPEDLTPEFLSEAAAPAESGIDTAAES